MPKLPLGVPAPEGLCAVAIAVIGAAAFPPVGVWFLGLIAPCLFLLLLRNQETQTARSLALVFGLCYALGTMYWFWAIFGPRSIPLSALMAGYFGLLGTIVGITRRHHWLIRAAL